MKKVCHITSAHQSDDVRIFHKECRSLARAGYDVYLVVPNESDRECFGVKICGVNIPCNNRLERMTKVAGAVYNKACSIEADIYHIHDPELLPYALKLKDRGAVVIYDSHEDYPQQIREKKWLPFFIRDMVALLLSFYEKKVCRKIDAIISVTPHIIERLKSFNKNTVMVTNYPINESETCPGITYQKNAVCFVGGISEQWLHHNVIKALSNTVDTRYLLAGWGEASYLDYLKSLPAWDRVDFLGVVDHKEVMSILKSCIVGMALNDYMANVGFKLGSLGNTKLFEYMQAGLPVICTDFVLWKEVVEGNECGICVNPHDLDEITAAIKRLSSNKVEAEKMGHNGRKAILEKYNWSTQEKILLELYKRFN